MAERTPAERVVREARVLARSRPTPFYLYDAKEAGVAGRRWRDLAARLGEVEVFYPYKCNRHPALLDEFARCGLGAEVTAASDLTSALSRGLGGARVIFQGPAKSRGSLDRALASGVRIVADGPDEVEALLARARALGVSPRYLLRLCPKAAGAEQRRFGMPQREVVSLARRLRRGGAPLPEGLAFHLGTGIASAAPYRKAIREAGEVSRRLREVGVLVGTLDVGGGFAARAESRRDGRGIPQKRPVRPEEFLGGIAEEARRCLPGARLLIEPGRALASDLFHLVTRVVRVRGARVYVDASRMAHAFFVPRGKHPFLPIPLRSRRSPPREIAGPVPVSLDVLSPAERVGQPREGDLLVVGSVGAYNLIAASAWAGALPPVVPIER